MSQFSILIVDGFYKNPHHVRDRALSMRYGKNPNIPYPGLISEGCLPDRMKTLDRIVRLMGGGGIDRDSLSRNQGIHFCGEFRAIRKRDELPFYVHAHRRQYSALVYLNLPHQCVGGTSFYRHKKTGAETLLMERGKKTVLNEKAARIPMTDATDPEKWQETTRVPMVFNRLIIFNGQIFHSWSAGFGGRIQNARLTQNFDFSLEF